MDRIFSTMKIRISNLRKVIREEVRRVLTMNEAAWGTLETGMDSGLEKVKQALRGVPGNPPKITKTMDATPTYWFNVMNLADGDVAWIESELQSIPGAQVKQEMGKMIVTIPNSPENDPDARLMGRNPAGDSVWDEEE